MQSSNSAIQSRKVVMICEDEQELLELYSRVLELKYDVIKVCSGAECINEYLEKKAKGSPVESPFLGLQIR